MMINSLIPLCYVIINFSLNMNENSYSEITIHGTKIFPETIEMFNERSKKEDNHKYNTIRERVICAIINNKIPEEFFRRNKNWSLHQQAIIDYIKRLHGGPFQSVSCEMKGGRNFNYDFLFIVDNTSYHVEFKFNAKNIKDVPQYYSPSKPSQYMSLCYEDFFYECYLEVLANVGHLPMPDKDIYKRTINSNDPKCMAEFKKKYKECVWFKNACKEYTKLSIEVFLPLVELDIRKLSKILKEKQNKDYMMYLNGMYHHEKPNMNDFEIESFIVDSKQKNRFICRTKSGKSMRVLLRWKNGNGIAYPAFQIS